jgi:serine/threonine protein kinase
LAAGVRAWTEPPARAALARCLAQMPAFLRRELQIAGSLQTTPTGPADLLPFLPHRVPTLLPGARVEDLDDLVLGEFRGGGNFAEVYEAHNPLRPQEPARAVKLSFRPEGRHLLGHEAWMNGLIRRRGCRHGVLPLLAASLDSPTPALVYPAVSGFNLLEILEGWHRCGRMPQPRWVAVMMHRLALVLGDVHACLFVHRDIKPGNLMIGRFEGARQDILLIDLGIAGPAAGLSGDDWPQAAETRRIIDRVLIYSHSPLYASPGQRRHDVSRACDDVYAAGVIAIRAIAGDFVNRVDRLCWQPVLAARGAPPEFIAVLESCVAVEEHRRPADGHDLAARLEEVLENAEW